MIYNDFKVKRLHKEAFVDGLLEDEFWNYLYQNDTEGKVLLQLGDTEDIQVMLVLTKIDKVYE